VCVMRVPIKFAFTCRCRSAVIPPICGGIVPLTPVLPAHAFVVFRVHHTPCTE
jgi:hypothetical protein